MLGGSLQVGDGNSKMCSPSKPASLWIKPTIFVVIATIQLNLQILLASFRLPIFNSSKHTPIWLLSDR